MRTTRWSLCCVALAAAAAWADDGRVRIAAGEYTLGSDRGPRDARPAHRVRLAAFEIDRFEVTNAQFAEYLNSLPVRVLRDAAAGAATAADLSGAAAYRLFEGPERAERDALYALDDEQARVMLRGGRFVAASGFENHPAAEVTWDGAVAFCAWRGARLPTEAEWEAAARGPEARRYPWGSAPPDGTRAVIDRASGDTLPVGSRPAGATPQGVHDLAGSLQEWTSSLYRPYPYRAGDGREDPRHRGERVTRGGDYVFDDDADELTTWYRTGYSRAPGRGHRHIGFRCALSVP
jgi:formylglycine-generating enzyme required for sulfatase activity